MTILTGFRRGMRGRGQSRCVAAGPKLWFNVVTNDEKAGGQRGLCQAGLTVRGDFRLRTFPAFARAMGRRGEDGSASEEQGRLCGGPKGGCLGGMANFSRRRRVSSAAMCVITGQGSRRAPATVAGASFPGPGSMNVRQRTPMAQQSDPTTGHPEVGKCDEPAGRGSGLQGRGVPRPGNHSNRCRPGFRLATGAARAVSRGL